MIAILIVIALLFFWILDYLRRVILKSYKSYVDHMVYIDLTQREKDYKKLNNVLLVIELIAGIIIMISCYIVIEGYLG